MRWREAARRVRRALPLYRTVETSQLGAESHVTEPTDREAYSFFLPPERIAQTPAERRDAARLMLVPRESGPSRHASITDLPAELRPGDLLVLNDTRVFPARILLRRATGGRVSGLLLEIPTGERFPAMLEGRGKLREGDRLSGPEGIEVLLERAEGDGVWTLRATAGDVGRVLMAHGRMPLPPYIRREKESDERDALDRDRYQTVFADRAGAVAAPTAGLHFTEPLLAQLGARGVGTATVTLHVGPGTFLPVRVDDLAEHLMHTERYVVPAETADAIRSTRAAGGRVVAVGTTVVRTLEAAWDGDAPAIGPGETDIFIRPPYTFRAVDALLTNFHLPESTLLMLVAAFVGRERILAAYEEAVREEYRFFSYGDAMLIA